FRFSFALRLTQNLQPHSAVGRKLTPHGEIHAPQLRPHRDPRPISDHRRHHPPRNTPGPNPLSRRLQIRQSQRARDPPHPRPHHRPPDDLHRPAHVPRRRRHHCPHHRLRRTIPRSQPPPRDRLGPPSRPAYGHHRPLPRRPQQPLRPDAQPHRPRRRPQLRRL